VTACTIDHARDIAIVATIVDSAAATSRAAATADPSPPGWWSSSVPHPLDDLAQLVTIGRDDGLPGRSSC
jgi:hypothetical protein